jgi:hypothetical protein
MYERCASWAAAMKEMKEMTEIVSSLRIVKPRELRHQPQMVIFCKYTQEAVPPEFWQRASKRPVSRKLTI